MKKAILGTKLGMTQIFDADGKVIPVTVVEAGPVVVSQVKTEETDGYNAVQVGYGEIKEKNVNKPLKGHFAKANTANKKYLREFRLEDTESLNVGDEIKVDVFEAGEKVDVSGISKGHGFAGPMKRWNLHRGPMSHGSHSQRVSGSMGMCSYPGRVFKGKKLPGHFGVDKVTIQNLEIVKVDVENNLLLVKGAVPGPKKSLVTIKETVKAGK